MITIKGLSRIYKKEIKQYLVSPVAYVVITLFLLLAAYIFFHPFPDHPEYTFFLINQATMSFFFSWLPMLFVIVIPAITMHLFSEEMNLGSYEMLLTMPVSFLDIIFGKFLAALTLTAICLFPTLSYAVFVSFLGKLDWGPVLGGYFGALLLSAGFCAIGLLISSITRKQIIALLLSLVICLSLAGIDRLLAIISLPPVVMEFLQYMGANVHFQNIAKGIIDTRDIIYFISISFLALYGTKLIMEEKK
jgi:ABC-2 type transport system permease protein